jgi:hypothetical protein
MLVLNPARDPDMFSVLRGVYDRLAALLAPAPAAQAASPLACRAYLARYPDVRASGMDPWWHYTHHGRREGRLWSDSERGEVRSIPDASDADASAEATIGGRATDAARYLARYPDVERAGCDPWWHYRHFGVHEGRTWAAPAPPAPTGSRPTSGSSVEGGSSSASGSLQDS